MLESNQLVCLRPAGILNPVKFNLNYNGNTPGAHQECLGLDLMRESVVKIISVDVDVDEYYKNTPRVNLCNCRLFWLLCHKILH